MRKFIDLSGCLRTTDAARSARHARRRRPDAWRGHAPGSALGQSDAADDVLTESAVLRDPEIPAAGNADGDITIVEYFDYNCPYCRKLEPELRQVVQDDGKVKLVYKDWPVLGPVSIAAARMALATRYQDKYVAAHDALMGDRFEADRAAHPRIARRCRHRRRPRLTRSRNQRQGHRRDSRATTIRPPRSASRARLPSSSANSGCRAR